MKKEVPKVYANTIDKELKNNEKVVYSRGEPKEEIKETRVEMLKRELSGNINQKIRDIFNSQRYIYKADVIITLKDKKITKKVIGRNGNNLITYDNELIPISEIIDIEYK